MSSVLHSAVTTAVADDAAAVVEVGVLLEACVLVGVTLKNPLAPLLSGFGVTGDISALLLANDDMNPVNWNAVSLSIDFLLLLLGTMNDPRPVSPPEDIRLNVDAE
jgi:hypothetical protein